MPTTPDQGAGGAEPPRDQPIQPAKPVRGRRRPGDRPSPPPRLAQRAWERPSQPSQIKGKPNGRPRVPDVLKQAYLGALRTGLNMQTAREVAGISEIVVRRWRDEDPGDDEAMGFSGLEAQARASGLLEAAQTAAILARPVRNEDGTIKRAGNLEAAKFVLRSRSEEFGNKPSAIPADVARQIREFVGQGIANQQGVDDPSAIDRIQIEPDMLDDEGEK